MSAEKQARVFFALWPTPALAERLGSIARAEAARLGGRATRPETIHITLAFIGDVPESRLPELVAVGQSTAGGGSDIDLDHLEHWAHNRIRWAGCRKALPVLGELVGTLRQNLLAAGFSVDRGHGPFIPHVTLVRKTRLAAPASLLAPSLHWPVREFVLVRSALGQAGSTYRTLASFPLATCSGST